MEENNKKPILCLLGHGRHGKDSMAEILRDEFDMTFESSSYTAAEIFIFDELKDQFGYETIQECYEDRHNHRKLWHDMIKEYNKDDKARLAKEIVNRTGCYVGMRDTEEIEESMRQGIFDLIVWVDASERLPKESPESFNIDESVADVIITNNGRYKEFYDKVIRFGKVIFG